MASGEKTADLRGHTGFVQTLRPLARTVDTWSRGSDDQTARIWNVATGETKTVLRGHTGVVTSVDFSSDADSVVTASEDGTARIWDAASGTQISVLQGRAGPVRAATFSPDGRSVVTLGDDGTLRTYACETCDASLSRPHRARPRPGDSGVDR